MVGLVAVAIELGVLIAKFVLMILKYRLNSTLSHCERCLVCCCRIEDTNLLAWT